MARIFETFKQFEDNQVERGELYIFTGLKREFGCDPPIEVGRVGSGAHGWFYEMKYAKLFAKALGEQERMAKENFPDEF